MNYPCEIINQSPQPTLSVRKTTQVEQLPQEMGAAFGQIAQYLNQIGAAPAGAPYAAYYNMDMQNLDVEMGFPVAEKLPGKGAILSGQMPEGLVGVCLYTGPYQDCGPAYEQLTQFVKDQGYEASGVAYEMYLNDPGETPEAELQTRIVFPLIK